MRFGFWLRTQKTCARQKGQRNNNRWRARMEWNGWMNTSIYMNWFFCVIICMLWAHLLSVKWIYYTWQHTSMCSHSIHHTAHSTRSSGRSSANTNAICEKRKRSETVALEFSADYCRIERIYFENKFFVLHASTMCRRRPRWMRLFVDIPRLCTQRAIMDVPVSCCVSWKTKMEMKIILHSFVSYRRRMPIKCDWPTSRRSTSFQSQLTWPTNDHILHVYAITGAYFVHFELRARTHRIATLSGHFCVIPCNVLASKSIWFDWYDIARHLNVFTVHNRIV